MDRPVAMRMHRRCVVRAAGFGTTETFAPAHPVETERAGARMTHGRLEGEARKTIVRDAVRLPSSNERDYGPIPQHSAAGMVARVSGLSVSDGEIGVGETASEVAGSRATTGAVHGTLHKVFMPPKPMRTE